MPRRRKGVTRCNHLKRTRPSGTFRQQYRPQGSGTGTVNDTENSDDNNNNHSNNESIAKKPRVSNEADLPTVTAHDVTDTTGNNQHVRGHAKIHENSPRGFCSGQLNTADKNNTSINDYCKNVSNCEMPTHLRAVFAIASFEFCYGTPVQTEFQNDEDIVISVVDMASRNDKNNNYEQNRTFRKSVTAALNYAAKNREEGETFFGCLHRVSYHPRSRLGKKTRPPVISVDDAQMVELVMDHIKRFGSIMKATSTLNVVLSRNGRDKVSPGAVKSLLERLGGLHLAIPKVAQGCSNPTSKWSQARWGFSLQILLRASEHAFGSTEEADAFFNREIPEYLMVEYNCNNTQK